MKEEKPNFTIIHINADPEFLKNPENVKLITDMCEKAAKMVDNKEAEDFWKDIIYNEDGSLNVEQIKKELADFYFIMQQVPKVYMHITEDLLSKPMYYAHDVIAKADDVFNEHLQESLQESIKDIREEILNYSNELDAERRENFSDNMIGNIGIDTVLGLIDGHLNKE